MEESSSSLHENRILHAVMLKGKSACYGKCFTSWRPRCVGPSYGPSIETVQF